MPTEPETVPGTDALQVAPVPQLQREAILPSADRGRLAAIVATCSMAGLAGGMALSMLAETQRAAGAARDHHRGLRVQFADGDAELTWLGLQITDGDPRPRSCAGASVRAVVADSPAAEQGFRRGDLVVSFGGDPVCDADHLIAVVRASAIGATPAIGVRRGAETMVLHPELTEMPAGIRAKIRR